MTYYYATASDRRSMPGVFHMMTRRGKDCITFSYDRQVILGLQGGCFIAFGAALSVFLSTGVDDFRGPQVFRRYLSLLLYIYSFLF